MHVDWSSHQLYVMCASPVFHFGSSFFFAVMDQRNGDKWQQHYMLHEEWQKVVDEGSGRGRTSPAAW
jgi:hypothetical protein